MSKQPKNSHMSWASQEKKLNQLLKSNTPTPLIAYDLGRSVGAVQKHVNSTGRSTKPTNKSPYNRRKK